MNNHTSSPTQALPLEKLNIFSLKGIQMKTFHITWITFFVCFFSWFALAPLMPIIRDDLKLSKSQIGDIVIASVSATIIARLFIGRLCDTWGPRKTYTTLLILGSIPVFFVGLATNYWTFLLFRLAIGCIGASFVITQFHTSMMFAPKVKGTANAVTGGWGNLGGGVTNIVMPMIFATIVGMGFAKHDAWRLAMIVPGIMMLICAFLYYKYTKDTPAGNYSELAEGEMKHKEKGNIWEVITDLRVWALVFAYALCFGMEITFDNVAALHFVDNFKLDLGTAGIIAGSFGLMNLFARALGGIFADKVGNIWGINGKGLMLAACLALEGVGIIIFANLTAIVPAVVAMVSFALFLKMANGATYAITPFLNKKNYGLVAGIVGAGGNVGGMLMGFLFKSTAITYAQAFQYIGIAAIVVAIIVAVTKFAKVTNDSMEIAEAM
jgi:MFS transporter, NNP family, nitrate/nitrite transporter